MDLTRVIKDFGNRKLLLIYSTNNLLGTETTIDKDMICFKYPTAMNRA